MPGAVAMFYESCGGDQNPNPRSTVELAAQHGTSLGRAVVLAVQGKMQPVTGRVKAAFQMVDLPLAPHTRQQFEQEQQDTNVLQVPPRQAHAGGLRRAPEPRKVSLPVQAIRFERGFTLMALGGEVVVDYALWGEVEVARERADGRRLHQRCPLLHPQRADSARRRIRGRRQHDLLWPAGSFH